MSKDPATIKTVALNLYNEGRCPKTKVTSFDAADERDVTSCTSRAIALLTPPLEAREQRIRKRAAAALKKHGYSLAAARVLHDGHEAGAESARNMAYELCDQLEPESRDVLQLARECYATTLEVRGLPMAADFARKGDYDKDPNVVKLAKVLGS